MPSPDWPVAHYRSGTVRWPHRVPLLLCISINTATDDAASFTARILTTLQRLRAGLRFGTIIVTVTPIISRRSSRASPFCRCRWGTGHSR
jgi:hypothetical protein